MCFVWAKERTVEGELLYLLFSCPLRSFFQVYVVQTVVCPFAFPFTLCPHLGLLQPQFLPPSLSNFSVACGLPSMGPHRSFRHETQNLFLCYLLYFNKRKHTFAPPSLCVCIWEKRIKTNFVHK